MRHRNTTKTLDRKKGARTALYKTQAVSLITKKRIVTTKAKAKVLRSQVEKMITEAIKGTLTSRRNLLKKLDNKVAVNELINTIGPACKNRPGGYIRIKAVGRRAGDGAEQSSVEIIQ